MVGLALLFAGSAAACQKKIDYFDYVSELRSNIFVAKTEELALRLYTTAKESPYKTNGIPEPTAPRFEAYMVAPEGDKQAEFFCTVGGKDIGGEMSYDNVKQEYFYACSVDFSGESSIDCTLTYGEERVTVTAQSVRTEKTLAPKAALETLRKEQNELFAGLTDKYGFAGEIYLRLLYEDAPYYYVGVIDREGKVRAFLMNAETGKILAKREG